MLASVIPPSREEVAAKFQPAIGLTGDAARGKLQFQGRCAVCHKAGGEGLEVGPDLITTKSDMITRDIALLRELSRENAVRVHITITTLDAALAGVMEPRAPRPELRLRALAELAREMGRAGRRAFLDGLTFEREADALTAFYAEVLG